MMNNYIVNLPATKRIETFCGVFGIDYLSGKHPNAVELAYNTHSRPNTIFVKIIFGLQNRLTKMDNIYFVDIR